MLGLRLCRGRETRGGKDKKDEKREAEGDGGGREAEGEVDGNYGREGQGGDEGKRYREKEMMEERDGEKEMMEERDGEMRVKNNCSYIIIPILTSCKKQHASC